MVEPRVAKVAVDMPLPHLDRPFDYAIPDELVSEVVPGCRVKVRFAGRQRDGYVLNVVTASDADRELSPLLKVVSSEVVLLPEIAAVVRDVADHYAGTFADVVRLAVPPRHGMTETADPASYPQPQVPSADAVVLPEYPHGASLIRALGTDVAPRAAPCLAPVARHVGDWIAALIEAAAATLAGGRGVLLLVPDTSDLARLESRCIEAFGRGSFVTLTAEKGPAARYRAFLAASRGQVRLVLGTRAAAFAPVADLGLIAMFDDGDDSWAEPRAPYPHARVVAALRASRQRCGLLYIGYARSTETQAMVDRGWLIPMELPARARREACPVVRATDDGTALAGRDPAAHSRLPHEVFTAIRAGLASGPVLVQVPRAGYLAGLACGRCRTVARCAACGHPLAGERGDRGAAPVCRVCGVRPEWRCAECGSNELRAPRVGLVRTAEELGRAFPQTPVVQSSGDHRVAEVGADPALVLATPGVEPIADGGYAAAVLLDAELLLARADLRAGEEALRRWLAAVALVRGASDDGSVVVAGPASARAIQALVRLDPAGFAERELGDRVQAGFPPVTRLISLEGGLQVVEDAARAIHAETGAVPLGPVPVADDEVRALLRTPLGAGRALVAAAKAVQVRRTAHKEDGSLRVRVDPAVL
ncbi:MAG: primosome assembly protein PriA [Micropruina sp.]|uniref:primosomal protein N' family DNA-binding protein n=1 Tax=Micropruina sp. TaxID=2737536 RepID=UPI0039E4F1F8